LRNDNTEAYQVAINNDASDQRDPLTSSRNEIQDGILLILDRHNASYLLSVRLCLIPYFVHIQNEVYEGIKYLSEKLCEISTDGNISNIDSVLFNKDISIDVKI
jgi:hypothetical protein